MTIISIECFEIGEGADGDRLEGRARPVGADFGH